MGVDAAGEPFSGIQSCDGRVLSLGMSTSPLDHIATPPVIHTLPGSMNMFPLASVFAGHKTKRRALLCQRGLAVHSAASDHSDCGVCNRIPGSAGGGAAALIAIGGRPAACACCVCELFTARRVCPTPLCACFSVTAEWFQTALLER